jgi:hypothetical protein
MAKILKIKVGDVFINGQSYPVMQTAWEKQSKNGDTYYEIREPIFIQELKRKEIVTADEIVVEKIKDA